MTPHGDGDAGGVAALHRFRRPPKRNLTPPVLGRVRGRFSETGQGRGQGIEAGQGSEAARQGRGQSSEAGQGSAGQDGPPSSLCSKSLLSP